MEQHVSNGRVASAASIARAEHISVEELMIRLLPVARRYARPPISNFQVGAVASGASGTLYLGANLEIGASPLQQTVHAEQSAIANAFGNRERGISAIAVTAAPCGHCRQFMNEIADGAKIRIIVAGQPARTLGDLLPSSFGPLDLGITTGMFGGGVAPLHVESADPVVQAALDAASRAWAPYTKAPSGCAVLTSSGRVFAGSYLENAAFNPSLPPLQSALVNLVFAGEDIASIQRVVLVEKQGAVISQRAATEAAASRPVEVFAATRKP